MRTMLKTLLLAIACTGTLAGCSQSPPSTNKVKAQPIPPDVAKQMQQMNAPQGKAGAKSNSMPASGTGSGGG